MRGVAKYLAVALLLLVVCGESSAQKLKERRLVRQGNVRLKWHASWVQNVVRQFGPYLLRAQEI